MAEAAERLKVTPVTPKKYLALELPSFGCAIPVERISLKVFPAS